MAKLSWFKLLTQGSQHDLQGLWSMLSRASGSESALDLRAVQVSVGRSASVTTASQGPAAPARAAAIVERPSDWLAVVVAHQSTTVPDTANPLESAASRQFTL
ncbi:MAG TPA: hypothetical protein VLK25_11855, partial [Allosphingosinicella sp.]|nr:hypothetical protein [Allosphingosinicella sp.]